MRIQVALTSLERMEPKRMRIQNTGGIDEHENTGGIDEPGEDGAEERWDPPAPLDACYAAALCLDP
jgi:hypothetical protein